MYAKMLIIGTYFKLILSILVDQFIIKAQKQIGLIFVQYTTQTSSSQHKNVRILQLPF